MTTDRDKLAARDGNHILNRITKIFFFQKNRIYKLHQNVEKIESIIAYQNSAEKISNFFDFLRTFFTQWEVNFSRFAYKHTYCLSMLPIAAADERQSLLSKDVLALLTGITQ